MRYEEVACMYCCKQNGLQEGMYQVRQAYKKPYSFNRYRNIGYCCDDCERAGKALVYDAWRDALATVRSYE